MSGDFVTNRDGLWHYVRRVPSSVAHLDARGIVKRSTKIRVADDPRGIKAAKVAARINEEFEALWRGMTEGRAAEAKLRYDEARRRARTFGFDYVENAELAARSLPEILARYGKLQAQESPEAAAALLGGESPPVITLARLFPEYEVLTAPSRHDMSPDQARKWRNPRLRAVENLLSVIGDKPVTSISRDDAIDFQEWWRTKLAKEDLDIGTANRDLGYLNKMLNTMDRRHRLGLKKVFGELRIEGEKVGQRIAYRPAFIQDRILKTGELDGLNEEARRVMYLISETGLRLSEAVNLTEETIILDAAVPHVLVRADGRRLKTDQSERDMPLVGVALMAVQAQPKGFPRYRDKGASLSALVNKVLGSHGLRPDGQSLYSLRHSFEDRLTAVEAPEKLIAALMGHKFARPKYGLGPSLEQKREWLQRIAFTPPGRV